MFVLKLSGIQIKLLIKKIAIAKTIFQRHISEFKKKNLFHLKLSKRRIIIFDSKITYDNFA